jgi:hypothetical protein
MITADQRKNGGSFISAEGIARAEKLYHAATQEIASGKPYTPKAMSYKSLDDSYLALYALSFVENADIPIENGISPHGYFPGMAPAELPAGYSRLHTLKITGGIEIPKYVSGKSFNQSIIDEHHILDIARTIDWFMRLTHHHTHLEKIGAHPLRIECGIYGVRHDGLDLSRGLPGLSRTDVEADAENTMHPAWKLMKERFGVQSISLAPAG